MAHSMSDIPREHVANLPTPVESLPRLSRALGGPDILVKRDDLTGIGLGGNKARKLEFLAGQARAEGAETLVTAGALQSNHCRQTAAVAARLGFKCALVLNGQTPEYSSGNLLLDRLFGAEVVVIPDRKDRDHALQQKFDDLKAAGARPYLIPYGGSDSVGAMGYVFAVEEFVRQNVKVDWIVFATSSGGTQAGLVLGQKRFGSRFKILGISIDESEEWLKNRVSQIASEAGRRFNPPITITADDVMVNADYCKAGYGVFTDAEREAVQVFARYEGLLLDPVYTGRAAAGLIDLIRKGFFERDQTVLFWHTGGQPALFAQKYERAILQ
jgi:D-cysteine desulfhydrase family pyridoxal phosphate-dependent enzyme